MVKDLTIDDGLGTDNNIGGIKIEAENNWIDPTFEQDPITYMQLLKRIRRIIEVKRWARRGKRRSFIQLQEAEEGYKDFELRRKGCVVARKMDLFNEADQMRSEINAARRKSLMAELGSKRGISTEDLHDISKGYALSYNQEHGLGSYGGYAHVFPYGLGGNKYRIWYNPESSLPSDEAYIDVESEEQLISELKKIGKPVIIQNKNSFGKNIPEPGLNGIEHYYPEQVCIRIELRSKGAIADYEERYGIVSQYYTREYSIIHDETNMSEVILSNKVKNTLAGRRISGMSYGCDFYNIFFMIYHKPQEKSKED